MKDNNRLIILIVGLMGLVALGGLVGLAYLEKPSVGDLGQIAFGVLTFFGGMGVEKQRQRQTDQVGGEPVSVKIDQPSDDPVPVEAK